MKVAGLDVSLSGTGIAVIGDDGLRFTTRAGYSLSADASFDQAHKRMEVILSKVSDVILEHRPELVAIEAVVFANEGSAKAQLWTMNGLVAHAIWKLGIPVVMVPLDTWRAWLGIAWQSFKKQYPGVSGYQRSKILKDAVRAAVAKRFDVAFGPEEHNECEAFAIAHFARFRAENPIPKTLDLFTPEQMKGGKGGGRKRKG